MPISTQDMVHGVDFTALNPQTASEHNQLVDQSFPSNDGDDTIGRSLNIVTTDSAVGIPVVPDATTNTKWKRYIWWRRPNIADTTSQVTNPYAWNDALAVSDPVYQKWIISTPSFADIQQQVDDAETIANSALATANAASASAATAVTVANQAESDATNALNAAQTAQTAANNATTAAATATSTAASAQTTANAALAAATAPTPISDIIIGSKAGQLIRVNAALNQLEYFSEIDRIAYINYTPDLTLYPSGTIQPLNGGPTTLGGPFIVPFNKVEGNSGTILTLANGVVTLKPGVYKIKGSLYVNLTTTLAAQTGGTVFAYVTMNLRGQANRNDIIVGSNGSGGVSTPNGSTTVTNDWRIMVATSGAGGGGKWAGKLELEGLLTITTAQGPLGIQFEVVVNDCLDPSKTFTIVAGSTNVMNPLTSGALTSAPQQGRISFEQIGFA